ncbi:SIMPL domain-containing protein [Alteromonas pelagimontana]|uniref:SIMPL domain-containing protein n=1 Tax=Alteromonas pelagimontana TaxID=1858656 RepID=A0A6M4MB19_9ALTE|nr:SIMPL domain-containing protein [Alteromonas pelagimontana]QJR79998.1 SIMPL domain-containing protein [Alteromonas pelagimontana]
MSRVSSVIVGVCLVVAMAILGAQLANALVEFKTWDRVVTVKGLSEREYPADHVIWPIQFTEASNDLGALYTTIESHSNTVKQFLLDAGIAEGEVSIGKPEITDKLAQQYGGNNNAEFRYSAIQTVTVFSENVEKVRTVMNSISALLKEGVVLSVQQYNAQTEYVFSRLNEVKPQMIEEATLNAREVAQKFAKDSESRLGKIKQANQGQFSISARDNHHPHIKKVRVVSTIQYTLVD